MDKAEIKRQLSYWEAVEKQNRSTIKTLTDQNKQVMNTIKFLKGLVGRDEGVQQELPIENVEEQQ
jgi:hypothetical protein